MKKKKISHRLRESSSSLQCFEPMSSESRWIQLSQHTVDIGQMASSVNTFNRLDQHASSPGNRAYCYAELDISFLVVAKTITNTHCSLTGVSPFMLAIQ